MSLGSRIRHRRLEKGLTQDDIAKHLGMGRSNVGHIENGRTNPTADVIDKIADILDTTSDYLLGRVDDPSITGLTNSAKDKTRSELLQEVTDDPDDYFFLDGYLEASEEEKKELRRAFFEIKKKMRENNIKPSKLPSLFDITNDTKKSPKKD
ncbi:helix-turn-helix transcriptional regulator [Brevibacillus borstelensis]|uniref:helix-turn-helix domain-containing protein n=1 Tax=Brevibacillus borstelensis TaxID=45462 RepID=UPI002E1CF1FD|nr:helix-turn-helix transcriptional regulator [Brevibacillus borstelensis]